MPYSEAFHDAEFVFSTDDNLPWKPLKFGSGQQYNYMNKYVKWLLSHGASFEVRMTHKNTLLIMSNITKVLKPCAGDTETG